MTATTEISSARQAQISLAFRAGQAAMTHHLESPLYPVANPYSLKTPSIAARFCTAPGALWHAFEAGKAKALGQVRQAGARLRLARDLMSQVVLAGRA